MSRYFVDDGMTLAGSAGGLKFMYRPALAEEVQAFFNAQARQAMAGKEVTKPRVEFLMRHLVSWEASTPEGNPIPLEARWLGRLRHAVQVEMTDVISGYAISGESEQDAGNS